jgi:hypothetical protein
MEKLKQLGISMDHSNAVIMNLADGIVSEETIVSDSSLHDEEYSSDRHEKMEHVKEQHQQSGFYKKLGDIIRNYTEVILFGPTEAKSELLNLLKTDHLFGNIKIEIRNSDKMTKNQMHEFVIEYFS